MKKPKLKVYCLENHECDYDEYQGFVVIARNPKDARQVAMEEGKNAWSDTNATCKLVSISKRGVVLSSFLNG